MKIEMIIPIEKRLQLGNYIRVLMNDRNLGFNQVILKTKINTKPFSEILNGKQQKINPFYLQKIAYALKTDYKILYSIVGYLRKEDVNENEGLKQLELPVYGKAPLENDEIDLSNTLWKKKIVLLPGEEILENIFVVKVPSSSMSPYLLEGDIVTINPNYSNSFSKENIYLITYQDKNFIKRVIDHGKFIQLMSDNPDKTKYPDIIFSKDDNSINFKCNGQVIKLERNLI